MPRASHFDSKGLVFWRKRNGKGFASSVASKVIWSPKQISAYCMAALTLKSTTTNSDSAYTNSEFCSMKQSP
ncbi:hypothetical protein llap_4781 [Limosa lapponica baueri]|uniref:Uncharacterized protein n=1 Tax=Limosa lapponica baueri TaxID=1758121 RepID=A0A2I0UFU1_LIMLA|nr:hypothetical protein llap_4781 [Limosa lapponica baueri]